MIIHLAPGLQRLVERAREELAADVAELHPAQAYTSADVRAFSSRLLGIQALGLVADLLAADIRPDNDVVVAVQDRSGVRTLDSQDRTIAMQEAKIEELEHRVQRFAEQCGRRAQDLIDQRAAYVGFEQQCRSLHVTVREQQEAIVAVLRIHRPCHTAEGECERAHDGPGEAPECIGCGYDSNDEAPDWPCETARALGATR